MGNDHARYLSQRGDEVRRREWFTMVVAVHLFLLQDNQALLLRRRHTGYEDGKYGVVAGHVDGGEEITTAMIREAREEAVIAIASEDLEVVGVMHRRSAEERIDFFPVARRWMGEITNREPDKCDELAWFDLNALPANVIPYVRRALDNYRAGRLFDSFGWSPA